MASPARRARAAELCRWEATYIATHGEVHRISDHHPPTTGEEARRYGQQFVWAADVLDDPSLSPGLCDLLPADIVAPELAKLHQMRSPHPLLVDWFDDWCCQACNAHFDDGAVGVRIGEHEGCSDCLDDPLTYCPACIGMAAAALTEGATR